MQTHSTILEYGTASNVRAETGAQVAVMPRKLLFAAVLLALSGSLTANVTLDMSADRIFLSDGSVLECTLICKGKESLVVLVGDQERTISASAVLRVERGQPAGERKFFETGPVGGHEQIIGSPEDDVPPPPESEPADAKPTRTATRRSRAEKGKEGVAPFGEAAKENKKAGRKSAAKPGNKAGRAPLRLPEGIDAEKIRKLINEAKPADLIKAIEDLKKRFSADK